MIEKKRLKIEYGGSKFWLIFWVIFFFPIAFVLLLTGGRYTNHGETHSIEYDGSVFWLGFWTMVCFPICFILLAINGISLVSEKADQIPAQL